MNESGQYRGVTAHDRKNDYELHHDRIRTALGGITDGSIQFCGRDVTSRIAGNTTQTEAILLWLLGRDPEPAETRMIDTLICLNIYPDIRIWSIRTGAYAAASGSPLTAAYAAAHGSTNATIFGVRAALRCCDFLKELSSTVRERPLEATIAGYVREKRFFAGFGRPMIQGPDERFVRLLELMAEWKYPCGEYTTLLTETARILPAYKKLYPNYASLFVAILMDPPFRLTKNGITVIAHYMVSIPSIAPPYEILENPDLCPLLPMKVSDVRYSGRGKRTIGRIKPCGN